MPEEKLNLVHPDVKVRSISGSNPEIIEAEYIGTVSCPVCKSVKLRTKDRIERKVRHESLARKCSAGRYSTTIATAFRKSA